MPLLDAVNRFADGSWFDIVSLVVAIVYAVLRWTKCSGAYNLVSRTTGFDVLNGVSIFPLFMLALSVVSSSVLASILTSNKLILSTAGLVALFAVLEDVNPSKSER